MHHPGLSSQPGSSRYRLAAGTHITQRPDGALAICDYPLRAVRLSARAARLLQQCSEERSCAQLADCLDLPVQRVQAICERLRWRGLLEAGPISPPVEWPGVSIIIPSHNRARQLERCVRALAKLAYAASCLEILVVDDASTDETFALLQQLLREFQVAGRALRVVSNATRQGVAESRNRGAQAARFDLLAYIDSDCVASPGWLQALVPEFQQADVAAVGGMIRALERASVLGCYEDVRSSLFMGVHPQQLSSEGPLTYLPTANLLVRKEAWRRLEGFAPLTYGEDVDFCLRLLATRARLLYIPGGVVYHDYRTGLWPFLSIRSSYASSEAALLRLHPTRRRTLLLPPAQAAFAGLALGGLDAVVTAGRLKLSPSQSGAASSRPALLGLCALVAALLIAGGGSHRRERQARAQGIAFGRFTVLRATLRGHLAYVYHLCRHLTRYYTLPLLLAGICCPPLLPAALLPIAIVVGVDFLRLRPSMGVGVYALCAVLDDCAYEIGLVRGCARHGTWKPLWPRVARTSRERGRLPFMPARIQDP